MRLKGITISCLFLFCIVSVFVFHETKLERQLVTSKEHIARENNEEAIKALEEIVKASPQNKEAELLLNEANKAYLIQKIRRVDKAYKKEDYAMVEELSGKIVASYSKNPNYGFLTEKVIYLQQKALQKRTSEK